MKWFENSVRLEGKWLLGAPKFSEILPHCEIYMMCIDTDFLKMTGGFFSLYTCI